MDVQPVDLGYEVGQGAQIGGWARAGFSRRMGRARTFVVYLRRLAVDLVLRRAFQDVDDLLTRMDLPG
jgi:hypothetical protein